MRQPSPRFFHLLASDPTRITVASVALLGFAVTLSAQEAPAPSAPLSLTSPATTANPPPAAPSAGLTVAPESSPAPTPAGPASMEATFDFSQGIIVLDVDISGGHVVKLALDTGDSGSVLDLDLAKELKLPFDQLLDHVLNIPKGKGPDISTPQIKVVKTKIGDAIFEDKTFMILPIKEDFTAMGLADIQGTIGYRFFEEKVVQIDYPARKLRLLPTAPTPTADAIVLPMQWKQYQKDSPFLLTTDQLHLGDHTLVAQFDTLFARTLILFTPKLEWLETKRFPQLPSTFYEGGVLRAATPSLPISLGSYHYSPTPPVFLADKDARIPETDIAAVMGNVFFLHAVVTLDYKHDQMIVAWQK